MNLCLKEIREDALENQVFTKRDVEQIFEKLDNEVQNTMKEELDRFYKMSGVFVQLLMQSAESQGSNLVGDVAFMEN